MTNTPSITICGIGPGHIDYVTPAVQRCVAQADVVAGARRQLELFKLDGKTIIVLHKSLEDFTAQLLKCSGSIAVVVSGDTGFYSLSSYLKQHLPQANLTFEPGISTPQYFYARLGMGYEQACLASLHGRDFDLLAALQLYSSVFVLTDRSNTPQSVAQTLVRYGCGDYIMHVGNRLSYADECIESRPAKDFCMDFATRDLCAIIIETPKHHE